MNKVCSYRSYTVFRQRSQSLHYYPKNPPGSLHLFYKMSVHSHVVAKQLALTQPQFVAVQSWKA